VRDHSTPLVERRIPGTALIFRTMASQQRRQGNQHLTCPDVSEPERLSARATLIVALNLNDLIDLARDRLTVPNAPFGCVSHTPSARLTLAVFGVGRPSLARTEYSFVVAL